MSPPDDDVRARLDALPDQREAPLRWDNRRGGFVEDVVDPTRVQPRPTAADVPAGAEVATGVGGRRHVVVAGTPPGGASPPQAVPAAAPPVPPSGPGGRPVTGRKPPEGGRRRRRRRWPKVLLAIVAVFALLLGFVLFRAKQVFDDIPRVPVASALTPGGSGTNILIVGTDSREGIDKGTPNAGAFIGGNQEPSGARTDSIMVLRIEPDGKERLLSIPRDLWVTNAVTGRKDRINSTYGTSPAALVQTVTKELGIPIQRYAEINFVSFANLVDAVGGITIDFPHPARDTHSGLNVEQTGPVRLDGTQALAYVRSRYFEEQVDGRWRMDPTSDLGRGERQRTFLSALFGEIGQTRNPFTLLDVMGSVGKGLRIDDAWSFTTALSLAWQLRDFSPESVAIPVSPRTTAGGAAVLDLKPEAQGVLTGFR